MLTFSECIEKFKRNGLGPVHLGGTVYLVPHDEWFSVRFDGRDYVNIYPDNSFVLYLVRTDEKIQKIIKKVTPLRLVEEHEENRARMRIALYKDEKFICEYKHWTHFNSKGQVMEYVSNFQES